MTDRDRYAELCLRIPDLPVFMEPWYLDALAPGWDVVLGEKGGEVVAAWPYLLSTKGPFHQVTMPPLVRMMGPVFRPGFDSDRQVVKLLPDLWSRMPRTFLFRQSLPYTWTNWLPFYWLGFRQTTRYSYRLDLSQGSDALWAGLDADYRQNKIPKAREAVQIETTEDASEFAEVHRKTFTRQGKRDPIGWPRLELLEAAATRAERRHILLARDRRDGAIHAGAYLIRDRQSVYLLMLGTDPDHRASGAAILLMWEAIQWSLQIGGIRYLDFLGSMMSPVERVWRSFGAEQIPYFRISHLRWRWFDGVLDRLT